MTLGNRGDRRSRKSDDERRAVVRRTRAVSIRWTRWFRESAHPGILDRASTEQAPVPTRRGILFSILEGLSYGCGDVIIGVNPAADDLDTIVRLEQLLEGVVRRLDLPTRYCVLSDVVKQHKAQKHTRIDVVFQSLAGTSRALVGMAGPGCGWSARSGPGFRRAVLRDGPGIGVTNAPPRVSPWYVGGRARTARAPHPPGGRRRQQGPVDGKALDDCERRGRFYRARGVQRRRATRARVSRGHGDGEAPWHQHGARRVRDLPYGHRALDVASSYRACRRSRRARVRHVGGRQRRSDARVSHHVVSRAPSSASPGRPAHDVLDGAAADSSRCAGPGRRAKTGGRHSRASLCDVRQEGRRSAHIVITRRSRTPATVRTA